jgi:hypothetical protein
MRAVSKLRARSYSLFEAATTSGVALSCVHYHALLCEGNVYIPLFSDVASPLLWRQGLGNRILCKHCKKLCDQFLYSTSICQVYCNSGIDGFHKWESTWHVHASLCLEWPQEMSRQGQNYCKPSHCTWICEKRSARQCHADDVFADTRMLYALCLLPLHSATCSSR